MIKKLSEKLSLTEFYLSFLAIYCINCRNFAYGLCAHNAFPHS